MDETHDLRPLLSIILNNYKHEVNQKEVHVWCTVQYVQSLAHVHENVHIVSLLLVFVLYYSDPETHLFSSLWLGYHWQSGEATEEF